MTKQIFKPAKRVLTLLLAALMLSGAASNAAAITTETEAVEIAEPEIEENLEGLDADYEVKGSGEQAITEAKKYIGNTDDYKTVDVSNYTSYGMTVWSVYWSGSEERGDMKVEIGSDGVIYGYSVGSSLSYGKIVEPKITQSEALGKAYDFAMKLKSDETISTGHSKVSYNRYGSFSVVFYRFSGEYRIGDEKVSVMLDSEGSVISYSNETQTKLEITASSETKSESAVVAALNEALPMSLTYQKYYPDGYDSAPKIRLIYTTNSDYSRTVVKASDGKAYKIEYDGDSSGSGMIEAGYAYANATAEETAAQGGMSEAEIKAVEALDSFIKSEEAVKKAASDKRLAYSGSLKFKSGSLDCTESEFTGAKTYVWQLCFEIEGKSTNAYATVNAETGELISYSAEVYDEVKASELKNDLESGRGTAETFLKAVIGDIFGEYVYDSSDSEVQPLKADEYVSSRYSYSYVREVNGIKYQNDRITVAVDSQTLGIVYFGYSYSDAEFPSPAKAISEEKAAARYWSKLPLTPYYLEVKADDGSTLTVQSGNMADKTAEATLVYSMPARVYIDALTGSLTDYSGNAYTYSEPSYYSPTEFKDVSGTRYESCINRLANLGVISFSDKFRPDDKIGSEAFGDMVDWFTRNSSSVESKASITRGDAVIILIDKLGYGEVAKLSEIFKTDDSVSGMSGDELGYAMIAKGLGLLDGFGDKFIASKNLTKGEAAMLICAYLDYVTK